jgi:nucleoid DNA-binding protein
MANFTKRDIVTRISAETDVSQVDVQKIVQRTLDVIVDALEAKRNVELRNFGVFELQVRKARVGRNPNRPETNVPIPSRAVVKFKPGKVMKDRIVILSEEIIKDKKKR